MDVKYFRNIIVTLIPTIYLTHIMIVTKDFITRIIVLFFLIFGISLFLKNIYFMLRKDKLARIFDKINVIIFFIYYFGFLIYWDYLAITNREYILIIFSLLAWTCGIFIAYRKYLKLFKRT